MELLRDQVGSLCGDEVVMQEPVKVIAGDFDVVGHDLSEPSVVGDHVEVDHDDVAHLELVDHLGHIHVTEGVEDDEGRLRVV